MDSIQVLWTPAGMNLPALGSRALVDITDGDTPNIRMPIRMLSIDTPEVTARSVDGAKKVDEKFLELAEWIKAGSAPVSKAFSEFILPKLETGISGTLQFTQGKEASNYHKEIASVRLKKSNTSKRKLFIRSSNQPFDTYGRLLAYVAPNYTKKERENLNRKERATFNLNMVESGWAVPFVLFPNIPGELDFPLLIEATTVAIDKKLGQYGSQYYLSGYEYRMCEKLYGITKKMVGGEDLSYPEQLKWRSRYCADIRSRLLYGPEDYMMVPEGYRLWIWPDDVQKAIGSLNLIPVTN